GGRGLGEAELQRARVPRRGGGRAWPGPPMARWCSQWTRAPALEARASRRRRARASARRARAPPFQSGHGPPRVELVEVDDVRCSLWERLQGPSWTLRDESATSSLLGHGPPRCAGEDRRPSLRECGLRTRVVEQQQRPPSHVPPTRPSLARNSAMIPAL